MYDAYYYLRGGSRISGKGVHIYSTKKLRKSQKTMEQKNTKANNYSFFIYLFRYISSVEKDASFSLLALIPLFWHCVK